MDKNESRLQHRGPPISPMADRDFAVILCEKAKGSTVKGVDFEMMDTNIPELIPAPHAPQNPQAPPGTLCPRFIISASADGKSTFPPALL